MFRQPRCQRDTRRGKEMRRALILTVLLRRSPAVAPPARRPPETRPTISAATATATSASRSTQHHPVNTARFRDGAIAPSPACAPGEIDAHAAAHPQTTICAPGYASSAQPERSRRRADQARASQPVPGNRTLRVIRPRPARRDRRRRQPHRPAKHVAAAHRAGRAKGRDRALSPPPDLHRQSHSPTSRSPTGGRDWLAADTEHH